MTAARHRQTRRSRVSSRVDYRILADLRYQIRRFLRTREVASRAAGVEPQHYLLLLQIKGFDGRVRPTIGALAERLQIQHHGVVQLVNRLVRRGMVERQRGRDRREVIVKLLPTGEAVLRRLATYSVAELTTEGPALLSALRRLMNRPAAGHRRRATRDRPEMSPRWWPSGTPRSHGASKGGAA